MLELSYFTCVFLLAIPFIWYHDFNPLIFDLGVWNFWRGPFWLSQSFSLYSNCALIVISLYVHVSDRILDFYAPEIEDWGAYCFVQSVILSSAKNFTLGNNFWIVSTRALIFHMSIPCDKTFPLVSNILTLWPWTWCLTYLLKTSIWAISFDW
jgi:hypothetical protein